VKVITQGSFGVVHRARHPRWGTVVYKELEHIEFSELTDVKVITQGSFGVVHRARHPRWGTVVYKELETTNVHEGFVMVELLC